MAQKEVTYQSSSYLACANCTPANVILCLPVEIINPVLCPDDTTDQPYEYRQIEARILSACRSSSCGATIYTYTIDYNEDLVNTDITSRDIQGIFCKGCLTNYIEDVAGNEIEIDVGDYEVTITSQHGCETSFSISGSSASACVGDTETIHLFEDPDTGCIFGDVNISADTGNIIEAHADGIFAETSAAELLVLDTESVNLTLTGVDPQTLSADVNISADVGNTISIHADGLYSATAVGNTDLLPVADCTYDLGSPTFQWKDLYLCGEVILSASVIRTSSVDGADNHLIQITSAGAVGATRGGFISLYGNEHANTGQIVLDAGNVSGGKIIVRTNTTQPVELYTNALLRWSVDSSGQILQDSSNGGDFIYTATTFNIRRSNNSGRVYLCGGSSNSTGTGALIYANGITGPVPGEAGVFGGDIAGAKVKISAPNATGSIEYSTANLLRWSINSSGQLFQDATNGSDIIFNVAAGVIRQNTSDAADTKSIAVAGGGLVDAQRGGYILVAGNENGLPGYVQIKSGAVINNKIQLVLGSSNGVVEFQDSASANRVAITHDGLVQIYEPTVSGTNYSSLQAQAQAANIEYILPATIGAAGEVLTVQSSASPVSTLQWTAIGAGSAWALTGNAGTTAGTNFVGTTDNVALVLKINAAQVAKFQPGTAGDQVDIIHGASGNVISGTGTKLNVIGGGGGSGADSNTITACEWSSVFGGKGNAISTSDYAFIGGGTSHLIDPLSITQSDYSSIVGGFDNTIHGCAQGVICGGGVNTLTGIATISSAIVGGLSNTMTSGNICIIGAGQLNVITTCSWSGLFGGKSNTLTISDYSFIGGGLSNSVINSGGSQSDLSVICGGFTNLIQAANRSIIGGGILNTITGSDCGILGGLSNSILSTSQYSAILGGRSNTIPTASNYSSILGGYLLKLGAESCGFQRIPSGTSERDLSAFTGIAYFGDVDLWVANSNGTAKRLKFIEPNSDLDFSSANYTSFEAQAQSADINYTLPAALGTVGASLQLSTVSAPAGTLSWINTNDGWIPASGTWTYASATTITAPADDVGKMGFGDKLFIDQSGNKFFYVASASGTTITIVENTSYTLANAAINSPFYSHAVSPRLFPPTMLYTATFGGFSVAPTMPTSFTMVGRQVTIQWQTTADGTSNATTFTISLPTGLGGLSGRVWIQGGNQGNNNGTYEGNVLASLVAAGNVIDLYPQGGAATWANTGNKSSIGCLTYVF